MKLSPPASSSDIEVAREIARRLNQQRRRDDRSSSAAAAPPDAPPQPARLTPPPLPPPRRAAPAAASAPAPAAPAPPAVAKYEPPLRRETARFPPPEWDAAPEPPRQPPVAAVAADSDEDDLFASAPGFAPHTPDSTPEADLASETEAAAVVEVSEPEDEPFEALAPGPAPAVAPAPDFEAEAALDVEVDADAALAPDQMVGGESEEASPLDQLTEAERSPFDDGLLDEPAVGEEPAGPSWDDIAEGCRGIASANGAMLIDPAGQVFAARGDWPNPPGPNAIATRLVAKMEAELKNAPTRSISAPFMGLHLTAWRVQLNEGMMTVAFIGRTAVRPDTRPAIDNEIRRGTGA